jgi:glutathione peroxidase
LYDELSAFEDSRGYQGDIRWNFEKFLVAPHGKVIARFPPKMLPDADEIIEAIEANLP